MAAINPFDFFVERPPRTIPFIYEPELKKDLAPYLERAAAGPLLARGSLRVSRGDAMRTDRFPGRAQPAACSSESATSSAWSRACRRREETLAARSGSCRDSAWLLVQMLRHLGLAARFVSGYLIQLKPDVKPLDGPSGAAQDFTDLHAWTEVYLPGAGWIGLDPTSGLLAGEGHMPLACTPEPSSAAPITGARRPMPRSSSASR